MKQISSVALVALVATLLYPSAAFFDVFKRSASATGPTGGSDASALPASPASAAGSSIRGVPDHLAAKFQKEMWICDGGSKVLSRAAVNDGYCDCNDGTDEPGTSACPNGSFYCINSGYKMLQIASSRVDDGVCDCCDGSDEAPGVCPNTCAQMADRERAVLTMATNNYKRGSAIRNTLIQNVLDKQKQTSEQIAQQTEVVSQHEADIERADRELNVRLEELRASTDSQTAAARASVLSTLGLEGADITYKVQFLASLIDLIAIDDRAVASLAGMNYRPPGSDRADDAAIEPLPPMDNDDIDSMEDLHDSTIDAYGQDSPATDCDLVALSSHAYLAPLCEWPTDSDRSAKLDDLFVQLVRVHKPYIALMLLRGYYLQQNTFSGAQSRFYQRLEDTADQTCPVDFESLPQVCQVSDVLQQAVTALEASPREDDDGQVQRLRDFLSTTRMQKNTAQTQLANSREFLQDVERYKDYLAFLALKNECAEVQDGKFTYKVCILDSVRQKEVDGHNEVTLGTFDRFEEVEDKTKGYSIKMHFTQGQYCHAFGARRAEVTVTCGEKNALKSASEPSTCMYALQMETPAACNDKYALAHGIPLQ